MGQEAADRTPLRTGMGFAASSFAVNAVVQLLSSVLTARLYGVDTIGEYALVTAPWLTLIQFSNVSEQIALVRELSVVPARDVRVGRLFFPVLGLSTALTSVVGAIVMLLSAAALRGPIDQPDLVAPALTVLVAYVLIENVSWNLDSIFSAFRAARDLLLARLTQVVSFLVLAVALRAVSPSVWSLAVATIASFALAFAVRAVRVRAYLAATPWREVRAGVHELPRLLKFAARLVPGSIANGLSSQAATWLLGALTDVRTVGAYSRAAGVAIRIQEAGFRLSEVVFPAMVERRHLDDRGGMRDDLRLALRGAALPLLLLSAVGGGAAEGALRVFGEGFDDAADAFALLLLAYSLSVLSLMVGDAILALDRPSLATGLVIVRSVVIVGLMVPMTSWFEGTGAAAAFCAGFVLDIGMRFVFARRAVFGGALGDVGRTLAVAVVAGIPAFAVARVLDRALVWPLGALGGGALGVAVYVAVVVALRGISAEERARVLRRGRAHAAAAPTPPPS